MIKKIKNKKVYIVFLCFFAALLFQHHFMWLYHDDYGYASLSYVGDVYKEVNAGYHTSLLNILSFLKYHYMNWGGRVLYFFFECIMLRHGLHIFRIVQSLVVTGIFFYLYKIMASIFRKEDYKLAIITVALYGVFEIMLFRNGVFWITASVLYLFPFLPFFMYIYYFICNKITNKKLEIVLSSLLIFATSFSQEQISALVVSFMLMFAIYRYIKDKKVDKMLIINFLVAMIGFAILMLSPGSKVRMEKTPEFYELNLFQKIMTNIPSILTNNFGGYTKIFTILFFIAGVYFAYQNYKEKNRLSVLNIITLISNGTILLFTILKYDGYFAWLYSLKNGNIYNYIITAVFVMQLILFAYSALLYFIREKNIIIAFLFIASIVSQAVMLVAPYFPLRSAMILQFINFILILFVIHNVIIERNKFILMIPLLIVLLWNYSEITYGYMVNDSINASNHKTLIETSSKIKEGEKIDKITLKKLPLAAYSCDQPYDDGFEYIKFYMKVYYELPVELEIDYE
ncbi:MAG: hypothetical protein IJ809_04020 [Clostridia bacterium]|nr:hypothetical protein [Clostridia bacterium]